MLQSGMRFDLPASPIIKTHGGNRNLVLAMLTRYGRRNLTPFDDGLSPFGIPLLLGIEPRVHLTGRFLPFEWLPAMASNSNIR